MPSPTPNKTPVTPPLNKITMLTQFDKQIVNLEQQYGLQLSCDIGRNVRSTNGDVNQWIGEVWYYDGPTKISTSAIGTTFDVMTNSLLTNLTLMLKGHAEMVPARRSA